MIDRLFALATLAVVAFGLSVSSAQGNDESSADAAGLEAEAVAQAQQKADDERDAPPWVVELRERTLAHYFPLLSLDPRGHALTLKKLRADLTRLHDYFERDTADEELKRRTALGIDKFVAKLSYARVVHGKVSAALKLNEMRLEEIIGDQAARAALAGADRWTRLKALLGVHHLRGGTLAASAQVMARAAKWVGRQFTVDRDIHWYHVKPVLQVAVPTVLVAMGIDHFTKSHLITGFILGSLWGSVQAGPIAHLLKAVTDPVLAPTTDFVKIWSKRRTGDVQEKIQTFFNRLILKMGVKDDLDQIRTASLERDNSNIAGMPPDMQERAQARLQRIYVALKNSWSRIMSRAAHDGRWLLTTLWSDEFDTMNLVQQNLGLIDALDNAVKVLLLPQRIRLVMENDHRGNAEIADMYAALVKAQEVYDWTTDDHSKLEELSATFVKRLQDLHVPDVEISEILAKQVSRSFYIAGIVTALAVNEARFAAFPEANRNMTDEPRAMQMTIRRSFRMQMYVERFEKQIQAVHREMKLRDDEPDCQVALAEAA